MGSLRNSRTIWVPRRKTINILFSPQRAAAWVLDMYYTDFPIFNPYLDPRSPKSTGKTARQY